MNQQLEQTIKQTFEELREEFKKFWHTSEENLPVPAHETVWEDLEKIQNDMPSAFQGRKDLQEINNYRAYQWFDDRNAGAFARSLQGIVLNFYNEFPHQIDFHKKDCLDVIHADKADRALFLAKHLGISQAKLFAVLDPKRTALKVKSRRFDWRITPVDSYKQKIPLEHIESLTRLREEGVEFDGYGIAIPEERPRAAERYRDPVLLGRIGRFWIEIGRW